MASVKVFPRLDKANKKGEVPIYLRLTKNRKSKYIALDIYIHPGEWNYKTGKVKPSAQNASHINKYIATKEAEAEAIVPLIWKLNQITLLPLILSPGLWVKPRRIFSCLRKSNANICTLR